MLHSATSARRPRRHSPERDLLNHELVLSNPSVQRLRRLAGRRSSRDEEGAFIVEGAILIAEAVRAGWHVEAQFLTPGASPIDGAGTVNFLADGVMEKVATTETPQPILAIVTRQFADADILKTASFVIVADGISDPGNLGTMLRSAEAAGADACVVTSGSVDPSNPKVVRSSAGSIFRLPILERVSLEDVAQAGLICVGTSSHLGSEYTSFDWTRRVAVVLGNEAHGLADASAVDEWVTIPQSGAGESLNVAMAATVLCFEVARQRRAASGTVVLP